MTKRQFIQSLLGLVAVGLSGVGRASAKAFELQQNRERELKIGRAYLKQLCAPLPTGDDDVREITLITGMGVGKTLTNIEGIAWKIVHHPCRSLVVLDSDQKPTISIGRAA